MEKKYSLLGQIVFFVSGLSLFWVGLALYYTNRDTNPVYARNAKSGAILGFILDVILVVLKVIANGI